MLIAIMTRGRVRNQRTVHSIPDFWKQYTVFVCPPEEVEPLQTLYGIKAVPFIHRTPNYSTKFHAILEGLLGRYTNKVVILDDDLVFSKRVEEGGKVRLHTMKTPEEIEELEGMFFLIEHHLDYVPQVGVHPRQMGHAAPPAYKTNGKVIVVNGFNREKLNSIGFGTEWRVDHHPILADTHLNCNVLIHGHQNRIITDFCVDWGASQAPGGCDYRTMEMQEAAIDLLVEKFGPFVKKVIKKPKVAKWMGDSRVDFNVQWKKMYEYGKVQRARSQNPHSVTQKPL